MASDRIENPVSTLRDLTGNPRWFWGLLIATTLWRILAALQQRVGRLGPQRQ